MHIDEAARTLEAARRTLRRGECGSLMDPLLVCVYGGWARDGRSATSMGATFSEGLCRVALFCAGPLKRTMPLSLI